MPLPTSSQWLQGLAFYNIFFFWSDDCQFFRRVGVELFFDNCYWRG